MKRLCLVLMLATATPAFANDALRVERAQGPGFTIRAPEIARAGETVSVRGAVCRRAFAAAQPRFVRVDFVTADGLVRDSTTARVRGVHGYRGGCGFYAAHGASPGVGGAVLIELADQFS